MKTKAKYLLFTTLVLLILNHKAKAQFLMDLVDTTKNMGKGMLNIYNRFDNIYLSGYIQPQFQMAENKGAVGFAGGSFDSLSDNRFMLRRGRIRMDYLKMTSEGMPKLHFVFQYDISDKGAFVRDFWGRVFDTKYNLFSFTTGIFARPFGYEINLGSADRESPERGRMSQTLVKVERDLGAMISFDPRKKNSKLYYLKVDVGLFNGQGLSSLTLKSAIPATEFDSEKDIIGRIGLKPYPIVKNVTISGGFSGLYGGFVSTNKVLYKMGNDANGIKTFIADSSKNWSGQIMPRQYWGVDFQVKYSHGWGNTELRFEYWNGTQTATAASSETPNILPTAAMYQRNFDGAFIYFLQNIVSKKYQIAVKYDWYDPNTKLAGNDIGVAGTSAADIKYSTLGFGFINYFDSNVKLVLWYDMITNESTKLTNYTKDLMDDVFTCRLQFRF